VCSAAWRCKQQRRGDAKQRRHDDANRDAKHCAHTSYWKMDTEPTLPAAAATTVDNFMRGAKA